MSVEGCAKAIVGSACRGDLYLTVPTWFWWRFLTRMACPEGTEWCSRLYLLIVEHIAAKRKQSWRKFWKESQAGLFSRSKQNKIMTKIFVTS
ncbi:hypothetical protein TIFTF001_025714 [Ficus carica]|uniref:Uncharacterized protein n=1 Tax=Ficus carica TaxID=3494 RepID=A0AA88DGS4_FICCA|nr:hypothetical protein TIFTF001_025714 [Ficus carica]